eukprot:11324035-Alexandrium_andersonii.AAC.1
MSSARRVMFGGSMASSMRPESMSFWMGLALVARESPGVAKVLDDPALTLPEELEEQRDAG